MSDRLASQKRFVVRPGVRSLRASWCPHYEPDLSGLIDRTRYESSIRLLL